MIPTAPADGSYVADDGGAHSFEQQLSGSFPGSATVLPVVGN